MEFTKDNLPEELIENFQNGDACFFVGAGLSIPAGLPTWKGLINELIEEGEKSERIQAQRLAEYKMLIKDPTKILLVAEEVKTDLGFRLYQQTLERIFRNPKLEPTENHELISKINSKLTITINYDNLIEKAHNKVRGDYPNAFTYDDPRQAANSFWKGDYFVLKAHGDAKTDIESLILSQRDYRKVLYSSKSAGYRSLLQSIFTTKSIVFLGVSMNDQEFNQILDYLHDSYHTGGPTHYLLLDKRDSLETVTRHYLDHFSIQTVSFENNDDSYKEITKFLKILAEAAPSEV